MFPFYRPEKDAQFGGIIWFTDNVFADFITKGRCSKNFIIITNNKASDFIAVPAFK